MQGGSLSLKISLLKQLKIQEHTLFYTYLECNDHKEHFLAFDIPMNQCGDIELPIQLPTNACVYIPSKLMEYNCIDA